MVKYGMDRRLAGAAVLHLRKMVPQLRCGSANSRAAERVGSSAARSDAAACGAAGRRLRAVSAAPWIGPIGANAIGHAHCRVCGQSNQSAQGRCRRWPDQVWSRVSSGSSKSLMGKSEAASAGCPGPKFRAIHSISQPRGWCFLFESICFVNVWCRQAVTFRHCTLFDSLQRL